MPPAQTDDLIRLTRAAAFSCCGFFYTTGCCKTGISLSIRSARLLSEPVSLPLSESSGAFLKKRFFAAEHAFMLLRFFIPRGMSCLCRHYEQTSLSTLCFLQMERKSCLAGFFPHISTSKEGGIYFHEKVVLLLKTAYSGLSVCHPFDGYRGQPGSAHPAGDPTYCR